ncbi:type III secretion system translocon subunit SctE (plasmid) [Photobacterium damselae subsp. piscicida]|uniref:Type III secretion system translocon subunit SctE n=1 Tax=Photobacterium damsela subsp. piscicida TaxID=38294 RepID=A0A1V1VGK2_PHODP|nr:type III secretion system translocon subunit SctE [Photobacterium damselae]MBE8130532.1 type III secretion system translocon subunit SctE [Photobacterium damselae subsp. piscicida]MBE8130583.1 type III secretion system translocon subunit SctE [Photobacterium damselae subsp. piscicida]QOD55150.1 type III secretion system translocon subunit SctE [Photobacterium damselae subsp. piscicida]QOD58976.1 type III secretion system translocon subunit SctE [Photobacterium damselae subsp. piscicida]GAW4
MSYIALTRTQSQLYTSDSGQTTLDKVTKTAPNSSPSVTTENVKGKNVEVLNAGKVKVQLDSPNAAVSDKITNLTLKEMTQLQELVDLKKQVLSIDSTNVGLIAVKIISGSTNDFEVELAAITDKLKRTQNELKIQEIKVAKAKHEQEMSENLSKIKESEEALQKAEKAGLASKIIGWFAAIASIVVGSILVATGFGAAVGGLMIAGGVMGVISMTLQEPAVNEALVEAGVDVDTLNKIVVALEIIVAIVSVIVTFGGSAAGSLAKFAAKSAAKIAQKVAEVAARVAANLAKLAAMGSTAATTTAKAFRFGTEAVDIITSASKGTTDAVLSARKANTAQIQAEITEQKAAMAFSQAVLDKLKEEIAKLIEDFQELMSVIMQMIQAKGETLQAVMSRPATV